MIVAYAKTDVGKVRDVNQDYYYVSQSLDDIQIYVLADGMGGYNGGEIASRLAVTSTKNYIMSNFKDTEKDRESIMKLIKNAMEYANLVVFEKAKENKELEGMGTTLEVCLIYNNKVYIGHIGDSSVYRIRKEFMRKLTQDHSYVETLVKDGTITREEAENHPKKNMLMKALGCLAYAEPDIMVKGFLKGDMLILSSDGLTNMVKKEKMYELATQNLDVKGIATDLVNEANKNGGYDNITVVVIRNI